LVAQIALAERRPSFVNVSDYRGGASTTAANGALRRMSAREQLYLSATSATLAAEDEALLAELKTQSGK
jgi:hypothetical protein